MVAPSIPPSSKRPYTRGARLVCVGDSWPKHNHNWTTGQMSNVYRGELIHAQAMMGFPFEFEAIYDAAYTGTPIWNNRGYRGHNNAISGGTSDTALVQLPTALAMNPTALVFSDGANDIAASRSLTAIAADFKTALAMANDKGVPVLFPNIAMRDAALTNWGAGSVFRKQARYLNNWMMDNLNGAPGAILVDRNAALMDATNANGDLVSGYMDPTDHQHLSNKGAYYSALNAWVPKLTQIFGTASHTFGCAPDNVYDVTNNPTGNIVTNSVFAGGPSVPTGWVFSNGATATSSNARTATDPVLGNLCVHTITIPGSGSGNETLTFRPSSDFDISAFAGQWMRCGIHVSRTATDLINRMDLFVKDNGNTAQDVFQYYGCMNYDTTQLLPNVAESRFIVTPRFKIGPNPTTCRFALNIGVKANSGSASPVFTTALPFMFPVADPNVTLFS